MRDSGAHSLHDGPFQNAKVFRATTGFALHHRGKKARPEDEMEEIHDFIQGNPPIKAKSRAFASLAFCFFSREFSSACNRCGVFLIGEKHGFSVQVFSIIGVLW
jgi:hypothetical protein